MLNASKQEPYNSRETGHPFWTWCRCWWACFKNINLEPLFWTLYKTIALIQMYIYIYMYTYIIIYIYIHIRVCVYIYIHECMRIHTWPLEVIFTHQRLFEWMFSLPATCHPNGRVINMSMYIWRCPEIGVPPNEIVPYKLINHPFWVLPFTEPGTPHIYI